MLPYWLLFILTAFFALTRLRLMTPRLSSHAWTTSWWAVFAVLVLMIGLRHEVGGDWFSYIEHISSKTGVSLRESLSSGDPAYSLLNWIGAFWGGAYLVNTVCAFIFAWGLLTFCRAQPLPWLALAVATPYLVMVVAMGYTRQGVAIGLAMSALEAISRGKLRQFLMWIAVAALFHKSAVILVPLAVLGGSKRKVSEIAWVVAVAIVLYFLLLLESVESLQSGYLEARYKSSGAAIRIAMNVVPAVVFLIFRRRFALPERQRIFWTWMAWGALAFVGLYFASPSSTAVDRVALYWLPLQLFVLSRLPTAVTRHRGVRRTLVAVVVGYCALVQFVWLFYADMAYAWLPYQFYPWVAVWR